MEAVETPVMVIEVLDAHGHSQAQYRVVGVGAACRIGRSLNCDIVLDDAYAAAEHATLSLQQDGRVTVTDLDSRNGTRVGPQRLSAAAATIDEGNLIIGRTHVRVRTLHSALPPEKHFKRDILQRHRSLLATVGLALTLSFVAFNEWQKAPEEIARNVFIAMLLALGICGVWIGLWALITRVSHGAWTLRTHLAIVTNAAALVLWSNLLFDVAIFATQWEWLAVVVALAAVSTILATLYLHLLKATHLTQRVATLVAVAIPLALGGTAAVIAWQGASRNVNRLVLGANVYPPSLRIAASTDLNEYLGNMADLKRKANRNRHTSLAERPLPDPGE